MPAANTLFFTTSTAGGVLGPLIAGVLVALPHGFAVSYGIDALLFTLALYSVLRLPDLPPDASMGRPGLRSVVEGLTFIAARPVLVMSFAIDMLAMVLAMPRALFPQVAAQRFGGSVGRAVRRDPDRVGARRAGQRLDRPGAPAGRRADRRGPGVGGWRSRLSGLARQYWLVVLLLVVAGAADLVSAVYRQTILQTYAPDEMRGRMQGVFVAVVAGGPRLGDLRAGAMASGVRRDRRRGPPAASPAPRSCSSTAPLVRPFWRYRTSSATD